MDTSGTSSVGVGNGPAAHEPEVLELLAELSAKQRTVIDALVLGFTVSGAADKVGVHRGTVSRWILKDVHFIAALNALELEVIRVGHTRLVNLIPTALMAIENAINRGDVRAALQVLKYALYSGRTLGSMSPTLVAKDMQVAELQQEVALFQQQTDLEKVHEETVAKNKSVTVDRNWRIYNEKREAEEAAEREQRRQEEKARKAAEARAKQAQQQAASAQKQTPSPQPKQTSAPAAQPPKHPGQSDSRERDARITAAAQSAASALSNPGIEPRQSAQNPGTPAA